jgi:hypothetical protein
MENEARSDPVTAANTTQDWLFFIAGCACGLGMLQNSGFGRGLGFGAGFDRVYLLPSGTAAFRSLFGTPGIGWFWALTVGLAVMAVGRHFRVGGRLRAAEWLAVSLTIILLDSALPDFRPERPGSMDEEVVWVDGFGNGAPGAIFLWTPNKASAREYLAGNALRATVAAVLLAFAGWLMRAKMRPGARLFLAIAILALVAFGPMRLAEAMSSEVASSLANPAYRPRSGEVPWTQGGLRLYLDARAWLGYSFRAFWLLAVGIAAVSSLVTRGRRWLWTEWAAFGTATVLACCWAYDEFVARPAFDRTERVIALGIWLVVLGAAAWGLIFFGTALARRLSVSEQSETLN